MKMSHESERNGMSRVAHAIKFRFYVSIHGHFIHIEMCYERLSVLLILPPVFAIRFGHDFSKCTGKRKIPPT